ncbi:hypothetical protein IID24_03040 [Patescibacteria group bacterium]|nr:hypothetical protein [Patescibacteria group bacterium]
MGVYDEYGKKSVQIKAGACEMEHYDVDDLSDLADGVYVGYKGLIVVYKGRFVAELQKIYDKWGNEIKIDLSASNPVVQAIKESRKNTFNIGDRVRTLKGCRFKGGGGDLTVTKTGEKWSQFDAVVCEKSNGKKHLYLVKNLVGRT